MKDPALPDVQLEPDSRGIELQEVGIRNLELPLTLHCPGARILEVPATWTALVRLPKEHRGTHMSRFVSVLDEFAAEGLNVLSLEPLHNVLSDRLEADRTRVVSAFRYYVRKEAPVTRQAAAAGYSIELSSIGEQDGPRAGVTSQISVELMTANLCPCSKAIAEQGAHNQRVRIKTDVEFRRGKAGWNFAELEGFLHDLEAAGSSELYPLLKRADEKFVTEQQYNNPKFVEDVARDAIDVLRRCSEVARFSLEVEAFESIHAHNAYVRHAEVAD